MLVPAGLLIVVIMASIAVDMSLVQLRQRQAHDLAAGAANDIVTAAADEAVLRSGRIAVDPDAATAALGRIVATSDLAPHVVGTPAVRVVDGTVEVELSLYADYIFAGVVPGSPDGATVTARASASADAP
ncbi:MAG: hypothetical protein JXA83_06155 [Acidimicrobiales bacterium]|nr:hypothetical protein [Acidimicrobiales bacterium]